MWYLTISTALGAGKGGGKPPRSIPTVRPSEPVRVPKELIPREVGGQPVQPAQPSKGDKK